MIVLSAGMQKAGTGWYFNLTNDLLVAAGYQDVRDIRDKYDLHSILKYGNCNLEQLTRRNLDLVAIPHFAGNTFVVKTHCAPSTSLRGLVSAGMIRATYIYRDPRDVAISAFEHGQMLRSRGETDHQFARLNSIADAIYLTKRYLVVWDEWMQFGLALTVHYEDLIADIVGELERLAGFLSIDVPSEVLHQIVTAYQVAQIKVDGRKIGRLHFNRGLVGRFKEVMSPEELDLCRQHFGDYLQKMGYSE